MSSSDATPSTERMQGSAGDTDAETTVIVSTGADGARFHRLPEWTVFTTACRTAFASGVRELPKSEAIAEGYTPCDIPHCFGDL
jgi:hypothetical protein